MMGKPKRKTKKRSLQRMAVYSILLGSFIFLLVLSLVEFLLHAYSTMITYKREADHEGAVAISIIGKEYLEQLILDTKANYDSIPEELRSQQFTDAYRERCAVLLDEDYMFARSVLVKTREETEMRNIQVEFPDVENRRMVMVLDGDTPENAYLPGQWLSDEEGSIESPKEIRLILRSRWYMPIGYGDVSGWTATDYMEITDSKGEPIGYLVSNIDINEFAERMITFLAVYIPTLIAVMVIAAIWVSKALRRLIIDPIHELAEAARAYTRRDKTEENPKESYFPGPSTGNPPLEIDELWETIADMERDVTETLSRIRKVTAERECLKEERARIDTELEIARNIQSAALPSTFPAFPDRKEFDLFASMTPAKEVGGDFYDFFLLDPDHLALAIADVSGKGIPAALFMMISKQTLRSRALHGGKPSEVLSYVNDHLCENNPYEMFVTIWFGILTISTGEIIACSAGHEYPVVSDENGNYELLEDPHGLVCGAVSEMDYEDYTFTLKKGGRLFVYTDGVPEAHNDKEELFGFDRIEEELNQRRGASPEETIQYMKSKVHEFEGARDQFDDITMLSLWYKGTV